MAPFNAKPGEMTVMNQVAGKMEQCIYSTPFTVNKEQIDDGTAIISEALKIADKYVI